MMRPIRLSLALIALTLGLVATPGRSAAIVPGAIDRIVFSSNAEHSEWDLYLRSFDGSSPLRLTDANVNDFDAVWSPDGFQIMFNRSPAMGVNDIYVMDSDGFGPTSLTSAVTDPAFGLDWSPDGSWILCSINGNLAKMRPDGSGTMMLTENGFGEWDASWSPDGSTIVFSRDGDLWLMDANGSNQRPLLDRAETDEDPVFSPDGRRILFVSEQSGFGNIWIVNVDGSNYYSLTNTILWDNYDPAWSPDGSRIAFSSNQDGDWDIWMMDQDGTNLAHLTDNPADERAVAFESMDRPPVAIGDSASVYRGQSVEIDVLSNDSDPDGEMLVVGDIIVMPGEGDVTIGAGGVVTYSHDGSPIPAAAVSPYTDSFVYLIEDERSQYSTATVTVSILPYFDDVPEANIFFADISWLATQKITLGCNPPDNSLFCPTDPVTRGQMAAFLVRARGLTAGAGDNLFVDDDGSVFEMSIDALGTAGVTKGCNPPVNDRYCPAELVTRGQMAAFLVRAFSMTDQDPQDRFVDDDGLVFESVINTLGANEVTRGCNPPVNDRYCPHDYVTREQMAAFIRRAAATALD